MKKLSKLPFHADILKLENVEETIEKIISSLNSDIKNKFKRLGAVVGISGGIDSSVTMALAVKALGNDKVVGIMLPEMDSNPESLNLARKLAGKFGVKTIKEEITDALSGFKCYQRRR